MQADSKDDIQSEQQEPEKSIEELLEDAKRSFALRNWDQAADTYGQALEALQETHSEDSLPLAPLHHRYGHALLEHAIATSGALGGGGNNDAPMPSKANGASTVASARAQEAKSDKEAERVVTEAAQASSKSGPSDHPSASRAKPSDPRFTFGGDAEESDEEEEKPEQENQENDEDDDLGVAFSVLELARVSYEKILERGGTLRTVEGEEWNTLTIKSQLAEVLNDLADVGLESENFQQASADYKASLELLEPLLQPHSRRLADAYLRLGLALEFHPDASMQASAEKYVSAALMALRKRSEALQDRQRTLEKERQEGVEGLARMEEAAAGVREEKAQLGSEDRHQEAVRSNGKGKATVHDEQLLEKDDTAKMDWQAVAKEAGDVQEMTKELELKLEEYTQAPPGGANAQSSSGDEAKAALQKAINEALLGASTNAMAEGSSAFGKHDANVPVNDLSAMVKKKKRPAEQSSSPGKGKNKAQDGSETKKSRVEDE